ncbi:MAG: 16S rRNA (guanine(527)-N(7))-methyltransferase RsmG [Alphaproteobacteria bacterium]
MSKEVFLQRHDVSRETLSKLEIYEKLLLQWQSRINLVATSTLDDVWGRHFGDSAQIYPLLKDADTLADIGSGAGFPGMVLAIMGIKSTSLIEVDQKKAAFLQQIAVETATPVTIISQRVENYQPKEKFSVVTSRACAPLHKLCAYVFQLLRDDGQAILLKGKGLEGEMQEAEQQWQMKKSVRPSQSHPEGQIIIISHLLPRK